MGGHAYAFVCGTCGQQYASPADMAAHMAGTRHGVSYAADAFVETGLLLELEQALTQILLGSGESIALPGGKES